jgi:hypothetical protein
MAAPRAVTAWVLVFALEILASEATAFLAGDDSGKPKRDCYIGLDGYSETDLAPLNAKGTKVGIVCTDCDPACDFDGAAEANGACTFRIAACVNNTGIADCDPTTRIPRKVKAQAKSRAGKVDLAATFRGGLHWACSDFEDFRVPVKGPPGKETAGKGKVTLLATKPRDKDVFQFRCEPRAAGDPCPTTTSTTLPVSRDDADVVLVLPALSRAQEDEMVGRLQPWTDRIQPLVVSFVSLQDVASASGVSMPGPEAIRGYLRQHFTERPAATESPRYLGLIALPYPEYGNPQTPLAVRTIPRYSVQVRGEGPAGPWYWSIDTDVPYGFLAPESIDGGDGFVDPGDLDLRAPTFLVFRIPISQPADLTPFATKANDFASADYRSDVALVAGEFGAFPGDTSAIQCVNATLLAEGGGAGQVVKVFDYPTCEPDILTGPGRRLADVLADDTDAFRGGMVYNISHGGADAIYAAGGLNLSIGDAAYLAPGELNVLVSLACANDEASSGINLAMSMFLSNSVAVVSATESLWVVSAESVLDAEVNAFQGLYDSPRTLLQALHRFRTSYYEKYAIAGPLDDRPYHWLNLLAVHVVGDGLAVVARGQ